MTTTESVKGPFRTPRRASVSTWALHSLLGATYPGRPGNPDALLMPSLPGTLDLLDVPAQLASRDIRTMELCHFHLPSRSAEYIARLKSALQSAGVELWNLLIDDGDIIDPANGQRDTDWTQSWLDTAGDLGAKCVRIVAGKQPPTPENIALSQQRLLHLSVEAYLRGVHVVTENWFSTLSRPEYVHEVVGGARGAIGLTLDFGNWGGETKYEDLAAIAPLATSCHAKCHYIDGQPDVTDFRRCLEITREADYSGPYTIVYGEPGSVWDSIEQQRGLLAGYIDGHDR